MHWQHTCVRKPLLGYVIEKFVGPMRGYPPAPWRIVNADKVLEGTGKKKGTWAMMEFWLNQHEFIAGDEISMADLFAVSEIYYAGKFGADYSTYEKVTAWYNKVFNMEEVKSTFAFVEDMFAKKAAESATS